MYLKKRTAFYIVYLFYKTYNNTNGYHGGQRGMACHCIKCSVSNETLYFYKSQLCCVIFIIFVLLYVDIEQQSIDIVI